MHTWDPERVVDLGCGPGNRCPATSTCCRSWSARSLPGGWLAFQVPGNFEEPSHTIRRELAAQEPYARHTAGVAAPDAFAAEVHLDRLARAALPAGLRRRSGSRMIVRRARSEDHDAVVALLREDVIREVDESQVPAPVLAPVPAPVPAAVTAICADAHQQLLVGERDGEVVATAQPGWSSPPTRDVVGPGRSTRSSGSSRPTSE